MRIGLNEILDIISTKTGIDKKDITFTANFDSIGFDIGKGYDEWRAKMLCVNEFRKSRSSGLHLNIYAKGHQVFRFIATDIEPRTNDIYDFMRVDTDLGCIGPGFYTYDPYLVLDNKCDKKDIDKFIEAISIDPKETDVLSVIVDGKEHEKFIKSLPNKLNKTFFKTITSDKVGQESSGQPPYEERT